MLMPAKSPSGSACPYYYMGGELHPLKYGSFFRDRERLAQVMRAEREFILASPGLHNRRIWIDLYETRLDAAAARALAEHIQAIEPKIQKLCFVGCSTFGALRLRRQMRALKLDIVCQTRFFSDPEEAKKWLVGENG
jgi:hypothetical protein